MHYVMAQESDEVKKETQALLGATRPAFGHYTDRHVVVCETMRFAANAEKHKDIRTQEQKSLCSYVLMSLCSYVLRVSGKSHRAPQYPDFITNTIWLGTKALQRSC